MVKNLARKKIRLVLIILGVMVSACETSAPSELHLTPCKPTPDGFNFYEEKSKTPPDGSIFLEAFPNDQLSIDFNIRQRALVTLKDQLRRWSSFQDILVNDKQVVRITLTYISPEMVEIIFLNHKLSQPVIISKNDFINELKQQLEHLAELDELYFLVTITDSTYKPLATEKEFVILNIAMQNMVLTNSKNGNAVPNHYDPPLGQSINVSRNHISGYVAFPMSVLDENENCVPMLDPSLNTTITLRANDIKLSTSSGVVSNHQLTWFLRYHSLMDLKITPTPVAINPNATPECLRTPPTPDLTIAEPPDAYWEEMSRYVWAYMVDP
ncbi:MAG: hypothetical protein JW963_18185 [Anaerolineales bacterium]|nr:hypothetical protein [Anaerolineales bacterium]